jgi:hypothetical protein
MLVTIFPVTWQRWRVIAAAVARLLPVSAALLWAPTFFRLLAARHHMTPRKGLLGHLSFIAFTAWYSGTALLAQVKSVPRPTWGNASPEGAWMQELLLLPQPTFLHIAHPMTTLVQASIGLHLPPVLSAAVQAASTAALVSTNGAHCAAGIMQHAHTAARMDAAYLWLEPLIAPLEPLLWMMGVGATHSQRRCHCGEQGQMEGHRYKHWCQ